MTSLDEWVLHGDEMRRPLLVNPKISESTKLVIVGAGLSGLCCAYRIAKKRPDLEIILHEKSSRHGGVISTWKENEWLCDVAVNATRPHPAFWRLIDDLNLNSFFKTSNPVAKSRWVLLDGKRHKLSWRTVFKIGPIKLLRSVKRSRNGGTSVSELIPNKQIADAMCLGIVNDTSENVDADFLFPSLTRFGENPPIKKSKLKKLISETYPIFTPKKGSIASIEGGMQTLIDAIVSELAKLENVTIIHDTSAESPESIANACQVGIESVLWTVPLGKDQGSSGISIYAIGYKQEQVSHIEKGYGTLIPDSKLPISGILHESDVHQSQRSPLGHRLFRLMVPHCRWDKDDSSIKKCAESLIAPNPEIFAKIGEREIPKYEPGHMSRMEKMETPCSYAGWCYSGVSITHVVDESERIADLF
tara:strand:+ start:1320 stop:2573 length:1254 start_codon:yes stop_codon:yes gene_type:complete